MSSARGAAASDTLEFDDRTDAFVEAAAVLRGRPRTARLLGWLETASALAVLPLLAGMLGVYGLAADLGASI